MYGHIFPFLGGKYLGVERLSHMVFNLGSNCKAAFQRILLFHQQFWESHFINTFIPTLCGFSTFHHSNGWAVVARCGSICTFLTLNVHVCAYVLFMCIAVGEVSLHTFLPFLLMDCFLIRKFRELFVYSNTSPLSISDVLIFPSCLCLTFHSNSLYCNKIYTILICYYCNKISTTSIYYHFHCKI